MEENKEKQLDDFIKKIVLENGLEQPSEDFTAAVLSKVALEGKHNETIRFTPLISNFTWGVLAAIVLGVIAYVSYGKVDTEISWLPTLKLGTIVKYNPFDALPSITLSDSFTYALLALVIFVCIQLFVYKRYLDRQFAL